MLFVHTVEYSYKVQLEKHSGHAPLLKLLPSPDPDVQVHLLQNVVLNCDSPLPYWRLCRGTVSRRSVWWWSIIRAGLVCWRRTLDCPPYWTFFSRSMPSFRSSLSKHSTRACTMVNAVACTAGSNNNTSFSTKDQSMLHSLINFIKYTYVGYPDH